MTQVFWCAFLIAFIASAFAPLLLMDTRLSVARREAREALARERARGGWLLNLRTGEWTRSRYIKHGTVMVGHFPLPTFPTPASFVPRDDFAASCEAAHGRYMAEERIALSVMRPERPPIVVNPA